MIKSNRKVKKIAPFAVVASALVIGFVLDHLHETRFTVEKLKPGEMNEYAVTLTAEPETDEKININTATEQELTELEGIGEGLAERIVEYREENGDFINVDELQNVSGIGEKTLEDIRDDVYTD